MPSIAPAPPKKLPDPSDVEQISVPTGISFKAVIRAIESVLSRNGKDEHKRNGASANAA